ncbi:MAG: ATP-dependent RNA helicase HrpA [Gammaproteobacteria bacterium]|nr:ATP-dependent RNA helicase HrpA [Gammaproteobacteria bacterium]
MTDSQNQLIEQCQTNLTGCMAADYWKLSRKLQHIQQQARKNKPVDKMLKQLSELLNKSISRVSQREQSRPSITYPGELPVSQKRLEILATIKSSQVVIVCGETGSGKTTQLPKICLEAGLGRRGYIGHTQPRRLAARSVASRIAEELNTQLGNGVGFKVRFTDQLKPDSLIKLMTDGILLAEIHHDPLLSNYDCIIIDEAHERSLNIDFLLGYLKQLLPKRPDLKIIITSATIDPESFSRHFNNAPIIEVSGRTYPVEVHYHPLHGEDDDERQKDLQQGIADAIDEISRIDRGDILVFLSGERDIRDTANHLNKCQLQNTEILPLLARLSAAEQNKIFHTSSQRRIILSTNVAETSLTVPGIKYVIDSGVARISRYSWRSKIQRLPVEKISQASANQRKGRCGRISAGICIRLYSENDFNERAEFTEPEIQRTNLAAVILQMENLRLGHVEDFPFVEPPDSRLVADGYKLLFELGAINHQHKITATGKKLSRLPIDPRLGRMLLEAEKESALNEVLIIVSALATQDPRERPMDRQQAADETHKSTQDNRSDFITYLNLWNKFHSQKKKLSGNQLRKWCKQNFISWMRMREWLDTHKQIKKMLAELKIKFNQQDADYTSIHKALLTGLLGNLGFKEEGAEYSGARNRKFHIFPGSGLYNKGPKWIMSAEIVETSRVYARTLAKIEPQWIEQKARHLIKRSYNNAHWEKRSAQVSAFERSTLYGLIINPKKKINYGPINPAESREIFIRSALVQGDFFCNADFFKHNQTLLTELETLEAKSRRQDIIVDDEILFQFYDQHIPEDIYSGPQFEKWLKQNNSDALLLQREDLMQHDAAHITDNQFPDFLEINEVNYPLDYHFDPGMHCDGITLITPLAGLQALNAERCNWLVPGLLHEKIVALIRSLPKPLRRNFVPAPNFADACVDALEATDISLSSALSVQLRKMTGVDVPYDAWREELLDPHLLMNFRVIDNQGKILDENRDLAALKNKFANHVAEQTKKTPAISIEQDNVDASILGSLPETYDIDMQGITIKGYPALVKNGQTVSVKVLTSKQQADEQQQQGLRQLYINSLTEQIRYLKKNIPNIQTLCMKYSSIGKCEDLKQDIISVTIDELFTQHGAQTPQEFETILQQGRSEIQSTAESWCKLLTTILDEYQSLKKQLKNPPLTWLDAMSDIQSQLNHLLSPHFLLLTEKQWLEQYPRYLKGIHKRLDKLQDSPDRDRKCRLEIARLWQDYQKRMDSLQQRQATSGQLEHYRWMLEEYRVSLFAQELKTRFPISAKRLQSYWNEISDV